MSSAHHSSSTEGFCFRIAEDAGCDRRASAGTIRVDGRTPRRSQDSHGFRDDGGFTGPSFLRLRRATSVVNVASAQVHSGRFSALDEDQFAAAPTLLDSLTEDLSMAAPHTNLGDAGLG